LLGNFQISETRQHYLVLDVLRGVVIMPIDKVGRKFVSDNEKS